MFIMYMADLSDFAAERQMSFQKTRLLMTHKSMSKVYPMK